MERIPVLIVGGGYAGLSAALLLAWRGADVLLVERHDSTSVQPKAFGVNERAMEMLRVVPGVEDALREAEVSDRLRIAIGTTLSDPEPRVLVDSAEEFGFVREITPVGGAGLPQAAVERILRRAAEEQGADLRFSTELVSFEQDSGGVTAIIRDAAGERSVRADYLVAADGHRSRIREGLGIPAEGHGDLGLTRSIMFEADLSKLVDEGQVTLWYIQNDEFNGAFITGTGVDAHGMAVNFEPGQEDQFTEERCVELARIGTGVPDLELKIVDQATWAMGHQVATRFSEGCVFLAGDAAHTMPPTGGQGGSTALQDGCDIAWRLALVLSGQAGPGFLRSYDAERRPIGKFTADAQLANLGVRMPPAVRATFPEPVEDPYDHILGHRYHSGAVLADPGDDGSITEDPRRLTGRPGSRAAHVTLPDGSSTIDLFGRGFVLLTRPGSGWPEAAAAVARRLGVQLSVHAGDDVTPASAVLVRPDGYVAWRTYGRGTGAELEIEFEAVLRKILAR